MLRLTSAWRGASKGILHLCLWRETWGYQGASYATKGLMSVVSRDWVSSHRIVAISLTSLWRTLSLCPLVDAY